MGGEPGRCREYILFYNLAKEKDEKGKANKEVIKALAKYFDTSISKIRILSGEKSKEKIIEIIQTNSFYLIEKLADTLCAEILKDKRIGKVELTIRKTAVWDNGVPGVTIARENS